MFPLTVLSYPYHISSVFPNANDADRDLSADATYDKTSGYLTQLRIVDYRYSRFALDPRTGLFNVLKYGQHWCFHDD